MAEADTGMPPDIVDMSFEQAMAELEQIVRSLEAGQVDLARSIEAYERGALLKRHCESKLREAEARIERITLGPTGAPAGTEPLDAG